MQVTISLPRPGTSALIRILRSSHIRWETPDRWTSTKVFRSKECPISKKSSSGIRLLVRYSSGHKSKIAQPH